MIDDIFGGEELPNEEVYRMAQRVVKDWMEREHKKIEWVAAQLGTTKGYLYASLDPNQTHKPLSIDRAIKISQLSGDFRVFEVILRNFGLIMTKAEITEQEKADAMAAVSKTLDLDAAHGDLAGTLKDAIADGVIDDSERKAIRERAYRLRKLAAELEESLK